MWQQNRQTAWIAIATTAAVVFIGVLSWILLGTAFSIAILLAELARPYFQKLREQGIELAIARVHLPLRGMELVREWTPFFLMTGFLYGFLMQCVLSAGTRRRVTRRHMRSNYDNRQAYTAIMVGQFQAR